MISANLQSCLPDADECSNVRIDDLPTMCRRRQADEKRNAGLAEWMNERTSKRAKKELMDERTNEWTNEWILLGVEEGSKLRSEEPTCLPDVEEGSD